MTDVKTSRSRDHDAANRRASAHARIVELLGGRSVVLVGMMGAGKTSVGKRLAGRLGLTFIDADTAIEEAAKKTVSEIFAEHGEDYFRQGERRVIARLLREPGQIIATGGGAFMNPETRAAIRGAGISIWLRADWELLYERVRRRPTRPLLQTADPVGTLKALVEARYPVYAEADLTVQSVDVPHEAMVDAVVSALEAWLVEDAERGQKAP
ncbi:shikimate kinase [Pleomorphomonas diazotrophica]|uniref:Shikimate kinase n=1 Tax=Pleomorphomonas diazotrophica TaxID=1166257 RepID=A0A1I4RPG4_9HYPH|nr:shikimate kinase [Pleomorphomonas diazotrophica]PKR88142.1 shikimate kinase [Pleomorphomonas diazotrophica]SFM54049.1 shikimate kinase [Pleomorphomonas diazotrophica]